MGRVLTVTEPWSSLSLLLTLLPIFFFPSHSWFLNFYSLHSPLLFISVSSPLHHFTSFPFVYLFLFTPFVLLSSSQITRKTVPKLRTCLCKSYKSQSIVCMCLSLPLFHTLCLTLCLCSLKLNFAVFLAAFESLVEGRQCLPQAFSQPFFNLQHTHTFVHKHTWSLTALLFWMDGVID